MYTMNFLYMAYGVAILLAMVMCICVLTLFGNFIFSKDQLNHLITPLFFVGLAVVGFLNIHKAPENKYINALLLSLILVALIGIFIHISGFIPKAFNQFIVVALISLQLGSLIFFIITKLKNPTVN